MPAVAQLEGAWVRTDPDGSGSFGGLGRSIPPAKLKAGVSMNAGGRGGGGGAGERDAGRAGRRSAAILCAARGAANTGPHAEGDPYIVVAQPCGSGGGRGGARC
jgi:hypothetical protein